MGLGAASTEEQPCRGWPGHDFPTYVIVTMATLSVNPSGVGLIPGLIVRRLHLQLLTVLPFGQFCSSGTGAGCAPALARGDIAGSYNGVAFSCVSPLSNPR